MNSYALEFTSGYSTFSGCVSQGNGGALALLGDVSLIMTGATLSANVASGNGGAVYVVNAHRVTIDKATLFQDNRAGASGGGLYVVGPGSLNTIRNVKFVRNSANTNGGGLYLDVTRGLSYYSEMYLCNFTNNTAGGSGGGAVLQADSRAVSVWNTSLSGNRAQDGGALWISTLTSVSMKGVKALKNYATQRGGAFFIDMVDQDSSSCTPVTYQSRLQDNHANVSGSAVHFARLSGFASCAWATFAGVVAVRNTDPANTTVSCGADAAAVCETTCLAADCLSETRGCAAVGACVAVTGGAGVCYLGSPARFNNCSGHGVCLVVDKCVPPESESSSGSGSSGSSGSKASKAASSSGDVVDGDSAAVVLSLSSGSLLSSSDWRWSYPAYPAYEVVCQCESHYYSTATVFGLADWCSPDMSFEDTCARAPDPKPYEQDTTWFVPLAVGLPIGCGVVVLVGLAVAGLLLLERYDAQHAATE
eukprot:TRINITY_DN1252_c0_g3_i1.p1 TRINITY_DN1252_c0_g3~~TRINITY_DN1252_c0_g3_i1.p1  ORF type:complete len:477 (-),score=113.25 TRINITY_DN1252_c0_g3_i1:61-1491(-)